MNSIRSMLIFLTMIIGFKVEAGLKTVSAMDLNSTCWASGWFGHYPNYDAQVFVFNKSRDGKLEAFQKDRGLTFLAKLSWSAEDSVLTYSYKKGQDSIVTTSYNIKMSEDGEYLYLEGSEPYMFQRTSYPATPECFYPW